jgi:radical SAM superfamily enzyme YgiQ (UPF0313 family)
MRALFVNPPILPSGAVPPPLSIATLASYVAPSCSSFRVFDGDLFFFDKRNRSRRALYERVGDELQSFRPDIILFTSMYNNSAIASRLMTLVKEFDPRLVTVAGGSHFGAQPQEALQCLPDLDFVIGGEGEVGLKTLLETLRDDTRLGMVPNLSYRDGGALRRNPKGTLLDLATLPNVWAASETFLDLAPYSETISRTSPHRSVYIEAGRGCPYSCNFCAPAQFWDHRYRVKTPEQIVDEMRYLHVEHDYDAFILVHDLLTVDARFVRALSAQIRESGLPIRWMANSRTDLEKVRDFDDLAASGCWRLFYGVDSGSSKVQAAMEKHLDPTEAFDVIRSAVSSGVETVCSFVIGHPDETAEDLAESILLGARLKVAGAENVQFHRLRLFPPAPLAMGANLDILLHDSKLDETTLKLEYPLPDIEVEERELIERYPRFYAGYFPPRSKAGSAEEISQIELFFTQAIAFAPLTVYALGRLAEENLVRLFRDHLAKDGFIDRYLFDPTDVNVVRNWSNLRIRLEAIIENASMSPDQAILVSSLLGYEDSRMRFVHRQAPTAGATLWSERQAVVPAGASIDQVIEAMLDGHAPEPGMLGNYTVVFNREEDGVLVLRQ